MVVFVFNAVAAKGNGSIDLLLVGTEWTFEQRAQSFHVHWVQHSKHIRNTHILNAVSALRIILTETHAVYNFQPGQSSTVTLHCTWLCIPFSISLLLFKYHEPCFFPRIQLRFVQNTGWYLNWRCRWSIVFPSSGTVLSALRPQTTLKMSQPYGIVCTPEEYAKSLVDSSIHCLSRGSSIGLTVSRPYRSASSSTNGVVSPGRSRNRVVIVSRPFGRVPAHLGTLYSQQLGGEW